MFGRLFFIFLAAIKNAWADKKIGNKTKKYFFPLKDKIVLPGSRIKALSEKKHQFHVAVKTRFWVRSLVHELNDLHKCKKTWDIDLGLAY